MSEATRGVLMRLCRLYLVFHITNNQGDFLRVSLCFSCFCTFLPFSHMFLFSSFFSHSYCIFLYIFPTSSNTFFFTFCLFTYFLHFSFMNFLLLYILFIFILFPFYIVLLFSVFFSFTSQYFFSARKLLRICLSSGFVYFVIHLLFLLSSTWET